MSSRGVLKVLYGARIFTKRWNGTLIFAEHDNKKLLPITLNAVTAASKVGQNQITCLLAGHKFDTVLKELKSVKGITKIIMADNNGYEHFMPEPYTSLVLELQKSHKFTHHIWGSSSFSRNIMPRVAAKLNVCCLSDVTHIQGQDHFIRNIYAGNAIVDLSDKESLKILSVRGTAFDAASMDQNNPEPVLEKCDYFQAFDGSKYVSSEVSTSDRPELASAKIVISGGRGMKSADNFKILYALADKLRAAVGASRAAVDSGFVPNELQVGQTGKIVAPELYIAVGISGAIQHLAGMKDSKTIVAINKDADAPIFQVADYGIVEDLFKVIPEMTKLVGDKK